jgi:Ser/Thr protein kinase RdoA (MazF antagonist)
MNIPLESIPHFGAADASDVGRREFGIVGKIATLPSERDQNFLITDAYGGKFVLKIANLNDAPELLDFQNQAMRHVASALTDFRVQSVVPSLQGSDLTTISNGNTGAAHCVRMLTWIDGEVLANTAARGPCLCESIGASMAKIDAALCRFTHPAMCHVLQWDLRQASMARENASLLSSDKRARVERIFLQWDEINWAALRHSVIHGDANDHNVLVGAGRVVGILDFGDMLHTATVCDLAIALAYTMLNEREPLAVAAQVISGYHRCHPLTDAEQRALFPLILSRLGMSVCYSAHNRARNPDDPYQVVTEAAAWELLDKLELCLPEDALTLIRASCADSSVGHLRFQ